MQSSPVHSVIWPHLHRESSPRDGDHRAVVEVGRELVTLDRGAHEDQVQVRAPLHHVLQDGQQEVRLDAALMDLGGGGGGVGWGGQLEEARN